MLHDEQMASTSDLVSLARELGAALEGDPDENVPDALPRLAEILASETDAQVVTATVAALCQTWDQQAASSSWTTSASTIRTPTSGSPLLSPCPAALETTTAPYETP